MRILFWVQSLLLGGIPICQAAVVYQDDVSTAEIYGRTEFNIADDGDHVQGVGYARLGFKARSAISNGLEAVIRGEWEIIAENSSGSEYLSLQEGSVDEESGEVTGYVVNDRSNVLAPRHVYAGFEFGEYGRLIFGQTETAFYDALAFTDIFNSYGFAGLDFIYVGRQEGQAIYTADLADLHFSASYQFRDENAKLVMGGQNGSILYTGNKGNSVVLNEGFAVSAGYNGPWGTALYGAYSQENYELGEKKNWAVSANYHQDNLYAAAVMARSSLTDAEVKGYEAVIGYDFAPLFLYAGYNRQELENVDFYMSSELPDATDPVSGKSADEYLLGLQFDFNDHLLSWLEYQINSADDLRTGQALDNSWTLAIQYNF